MRLDAMPVAVLLMLLSIVNGAYASDPSAVNFTTTLVSAGNFSTFTNLLQSTGLEATLMSAELTSGITLFAPTDEAFAALPVGDMATLMQSQIIILLQYHVLPFYFTLTTLESISSPIQTLAAQSGGSYRLNLSTIADVLTLNTGIHTAEVLTTLVDQSPMVAVYVISDVLFPAGLLSQAPGSSPVSSPAYSPAALVPLLGPVSAPAPGPVPSFFRPFLPPPTGIENPGNAPSAVPQSSSASRNGLFQFWSTYLVAAMVAFTMLFMQ